MTTETKSLVGTMAVFDANQVRSISFVGGQQIMTWLPAGRYVAIRQERIKFSDLGRVSESNAVAIRKDLPLGEYAVGDHQVYYVHPSAFVANKPI